MNDNLPTMPALAAKDQQASQARPSPLHVYAALGTYAKRSNLPEAPASTGSGDAGEGEVVYEGEGVKIYQAQIRSNDRNCFRCGDWAAITGIVLLKLDEEELRVCYHVTFPDGANDYWPTSEKYDMAKGPIA